MVIALIDPTSRGEGGAAMLASAGLDVEVGALADEAGILLGPWLTAQERRRPVITWAYVISGHGITPLPAESADAYQLRVNADAILLSDGSISEALPGSHGPGILTLKDIAPGTDTRDAATALYEGGVRNLLLHGGLDVAGQFLEHQLIDRVVAYIPDSYEPQSPAARLPWPQLPPGFAILGAGKVDGFARIEAERSG